MAHYKALIVDDDRVAMKYYEWALERAGFEISRCYTADDVIAAAVELVPDIILIDIMLAPGNAYSLASTEYGLSTGVLLIKDLIERVPDIPRLVLTVIQMPESIEALRKQGETVLRKKDWPPNELVAMVLSIVGAHNP